MSGTRFARTGRGRFFIIIVAGLLLFAIVTIFQNSQQRLSETQERQSRCEHQQEALNARLQDMTDQKFNAEKAQERERDEQLKIIKSLELKMRSQKENFDSEQKDTGLKLEKSQQMLKQLQTEHNRLVGLCELKKSENNAELTALRSKLEKQQKTHELEVKELNHKYDQLQSQLSAQAAPAASTQLRLSLLEDIVSDYRTNCAYKPRQFAQLSIDKPVEATLKSSSTPSLGIPKPGFVKSFNEQQLVSPDVYRINMKITNLTQNASTEVNANKINTQDNATVLSTTFSNGVGFIQLKKETPAVPYNSANNQSLIINSVENFQIAPKDIEKQPVNEAQQNVVTQRSSSDSLQKSLAKDEDQRKAPELSSKQPPISAAAVHGPAIKRKLPENVAPIPDNYADFASAVVKKAALAAPEQESKDAADINAAVEVTQKNEDGGTNNRYSNVVNDAAFKAENVDSGAHEDKDHDEVPQPSQEKDVDAGKADNMVLVGADNYNSGNIAAAGEARAKPDNGLFDGDNMNNEVAGDQGKEFVDGLRMEDANEEDDADDPEDYSNPGRNKGAEAIRN